jgi:alpha-D-ribose 1-methylphosphonate 5-triphosphate diphosphatase
MTPETVLTSARVVTPDSVFAGTVHVVGPRIAAVEAGTSRAAGAVDIDGDYLMPGIIDIHTDNLERHLEPRPNVHWPNMAALLTHDRQMAAAGVTTVFDSLCVGDHATGGSGRYEALIRCLQAMEQAQADGLLKSEHLLHLRCEVTAEGVVEAFRRYVDDPLVRLVSVMDHTPGQRQWSNLEKWRQFNRRLNVSDAKLDAILDHRRRVQADRGPPARRQIVAICKALGLTLASHDDTTAAHVEQAAADGIAISEFPTTEEAARLARARGLQVVMGAPNVVLGGSHSGNVSARSLAALGLVDALASDYVPVSLIHACFLFHEHLGMQLPAAAAVVTGNAARMVGFDDRGEIAVGKRADLLRVKAYHHVPVVRAVWREGRLIA